MRLINVKTLQIEEFIDGYVPRYAILSHTWLKEEVTFSDMQNGGSLCDKAGWHKIQYSIEQATADGLGFLWVDTCCIDKSSSAELSEAINSMFAWYREATVCYAFLADIPFPLVGDDTEYTLGKSRWFTRGWTLQELLAPENVRFYSSEWRCLGTKAELSSVISCITAIDV